MSQENPRIGEIRDKIKSFELLRSDLGDVLVEARIAALQEELRCIETGGGAYFEGDTQAQGDFVAGGKQIAGDAVGGNKSVGSEVGGDQLNAQSITIVHNHLPAETSSEKQKPAKPRAAPAKKKPAGPVEIPFEPALHAYLLALIADYRPLRLAGLDEHTGDPQRVRLSLEDIYISLNTTDQKEPEGGKAQKKPEAAFAEREKSQPLAALEALAQAKEQRMVLLGYPGTGKSTFVRYLALRMAQALDGAAPGIENWPGGQPLLPVAISLGRFAECLAQVKKGACTHLEEFLLETLKADERTAAFAPHLLAALERQGGLFMFDGLDEVADLSLRPQVAEAIEAFAGHYGRNPRSRFLVTCRTYSYQDPRWQLAGWQRRELALLDDEQIAQFVTAWYDQHTLLDASRRLEYAQKKEKLLQALRPDDRRRLAQIARYPIILTMMAIVHANYELPDSRAQVYQRCVDLLLEKWNATRRIQGQEQTRNLLAELGETRSIVDQALFAIAFEAHQGRESDDASGGLVTEKLVSGVLSEYLQGPEQLKIFLEYCQSANGLLMLQGTLSPGAGGGKVRRVYTFPHLTFEEYLAARHLESLGGEEARRLLDQAHDRWREVVKFLAEYLSFDRNDRVRMKDLLEALGKGLPEKPSENDWRAAWLAGELLALYRRAFRKPLEVEAEIMTGLQRLTAAATLSPRERAAAADALDELGWLPGDLHRFVQIGEGAFWMGQYPVTNAQYERFLQVENFANRELWLNFPKFSEPDGQGKIKELGDWGEEGWKWPQKNRGGERVIEPLYWRDPRFGIARRGAPVVGITWYEANAYCKWLLRHWAELEEGRANPELRPQIVRLPTEAEWVLAAGGAQPEDRFPWDAPGEITREQGEILRRANVREGGIGRTTPVGMYPLGISQPYGLHDLAGNVWEWQANNYSGGLALRGGSWSLSGRFARLPVRDLSSPDLGYDGFGLRLAALPNQPL